MVFINRPVAAHVIYVMAGLFQDTAAAIIRKKRKAVRFGYIILKLLSPDTRQSLSDRTPRSGESAVPTPSYC